jgi:hypothetical protein
MYNFDFFVQTGIINDPNILFIFVINGHNCSIEIPDYENCVILKRDNIGYDFGAHRASLDYLTDLYSCSVKDIPFDYFIFMNCGVIGPFLPKYYPKNVHWTTIFTDNLNDKIKLFGTSLVCFEYNASMGNGPHIEGFFFCLDKIGLSTVFNTKTVFVNHKTKQEAVNNGEYGLSKAILNAGYSLDCMLYKYQNIDWSNKQNWINQNNNSFPSRSGTYEGITIHPFEVIFHKWFWLNELPVNFNYVIRYKKWKLNEIIKNKKVHVIFGSGEYMINVTNKIMDKYFENNKLIIPTDYHLDDEFKKISVAFNNNSCMLMVYINSVSYTIRHNIYESVILFIDNIFDIEVFYGCDNFKVDVTNKFINTFIKHDKVIIPKKYVFNSCFGDVCPGNQKKLYIRIGENEYIVREDNLIDLEFNVVMK